MTYRKGHDDVGVWKGAKIVQLKFCVEEAWFDLRSSQPLDSGYSIGGPNWRQNGRRGMKGELEVGQHRLFGAEGEDNNDIIVDCTAAACKYYVYIKCVKQGS